MIFQRLHTRERYEGTGIGLALSRKIVEFHGGEIAVEPGPPPGTTITVTLPLLAEGAEGQGVQCRGSEGRELEGPGPSD